MKKIAFLLILALLLTGCASNQPEQPWPHAFILRDRVRITLDAPAAPILSALGPPFGYAERSGGSGLERSYHFHGMDLETYRSRDGERIREIRLTDDSVQTGEGIHVGSTAGQVRERFGENAIREGCCILERGQDRLILTLKNNTVTQIRYLLLPGNRQ